MEVDQHFRAGYAHLSWGFSPDGGSPNGVQRWANNSVFEYIRIVRTEYIRKPNYSVLFKNRIIFVFVFGFNFQTECIRIRIRFYFWTEYIRIRIRFLFWTEYICIRIRIIFPNRIVFALYHKFFYPRGCIVTLVTFFSVFICLLKWPVWEDA